MKLAEITNLGQAFNSLIRRSTDPESFLMKLLSTSQYAERHATKSTLNCLSPSYDNQHAPNENVQNKDPLVEL